MKGNVDLGSVRKESIWFLLILEFANSSLKKKALLLNRKEEHDSGGCGICCR